MACERSIAAVPLLRKKRRAVKQDEKIAERVFGIGCTESQFAAAHGERCSDIDFRNSSERERASA